MTSETYIPSPPLQPFIEKFRVITCQEGIINNIIPGTSQVMALRVKGEVSTLEEGQKIALPLSSISGIRQTNRIIQYESNSANIVVQFKEGGAGAFIKEPLYELFNESYALGELSNFKQLELIEEQLAEAAGNLQRIAIIEKFLLSRLLQPQKDTLIQEALHIIQRSRGQLKIKPLTEQLYISQDAFEKRFRRIVGVSAKQYAGIIRIRSIIDSCPSKDLLPALIFDAGYFDQPHFNKDFKRFTGQTPSDFFRTHPIW